MIFLRFLRYRIKADINIKRSAVRLLIIYFLLLSFAFAEDDSNEIIDVYFSPKGGCTEAIVRQIYGAKKEVLVISYLLTSKPIAQAIVEAYNRGVSVLVVLDKSNKNSKYSPADFLSYYGIPVYIDSAHAIMHNKVIIIDNEVVITGSFNFTGSAENKNAENLLIIKSTEYAGKYKSNFNLHMEHSALYYPKLIK